MNLNIGDKIGEFLVLSIIPGSRKYNPKYLCKCQCGNELELSKYFLEKYKDCGCITYVRAHSGIGTVNEGDILGDITILKKASGKNRNSIYDCVCVCGEKFRLTHASIVRKSKKDKLDCGCISGDRLKDFKTRLLGKRSGKLTAIKWLKVENQANVWLCKCDCGNYTEVSAANFNFRTQSCGKCGREKVKTISLIPAYLLKNIKTGALSREFSYELTEDFLWNLYKKQEGKCKLTGRKIIFNKKSKENTASLDRINSKLGYTEENVQWIHKDVNIIKNRFDEDYFLGICLDICNNKTISNIDRPAWCDYFFGIALIASTRSMDSQTKVGSVITTKDNLILGTGYNSFPKNMPDNELPNVRPEKYDFIIHSEISCISNCTSLQDAYSIYVTQKPCLNCLKSILATPIKNIFVLDNNENDDNSSEYEILLHRSLINMYKVKPNLDYLRLLINSIYDKSKLTDKENFSSTIICQNYKEDKPTKFIRVGQGISEVSHFGDFE